MSMSAAISREFTCCCSGRATSPGKPPTDRAASSEDGSEATKQFWPPLVSDKLFQTNSGSGMAESHTGSRETFMESFEASSQQRDNALNWVVREYRFTMLLPSKRLTNALSRSIF